MDALGIVRAGLALVILAWLPGYAWTRALMPRLAPLERFVLSVTVSIALVTLAIVVGDLLLGLRVSGTMGVTLALVLTALAFIPWALRGQGRRREEGSASERAPPRS